MHTTTRIDRYEIVSEIGRGGMAIVHLARHVELGRLVALKEMSSLTGATEEAAKRFLREAQITAALQHPNIVSVFDCFEANGVPYIAMEYLSHGSLRDCERPLSLEQTCGVIHDVLAGLAEAERLAVIHRDLKPENLLVTDTGSVKIADFGIAKALGGDLEGTRLTTTGVAMGTPAYMAPEQATGEGVGTATDLYAVGVIVYEMLTGEVPFDGATTPLQVLIRRATEPPPDPNAAVPDLDRRLARWITALLATRPSDRPAGAAQAWQALEPIAADVCGADWPTRASLLYERQLTARESGYVTFHQPSSPLPPETDGDVTDHLATGAAAVDAGTEAAAAEDQLLRELLVVAALPGPGVPEDGGPPELVVKAGESTEIAIRVRNQGDTVAAFAISAEGIPAAWWSAAPAQLHLNPFGTSGEQQADARIRFHPPRGPEALAKRWPVTVRVHRCDRPEAPVERSLDLGLTVVPFVDLSGRLLPAEAAGLRRGHFFVEVVNQGNTDTTVHTSIRDARDACRFRFTEEVSVPAGEPRRIECEVRPRRFHWVGHPVTHSLNGEMATSPNGAMPPALAGRFVQRALLPWWLAWLLGLLLAAAAAAGTVLATREPSPPPPAGQNAIQPAGGQSTTGPGPAVSQPTTSTQAAVRVPNVVGESLARARTLIQDRGLDVGEVTPANFPSSTPVEQQSPAAGQQVNAQSAVDLTLKSVKLPDLHGLTLTKANDTLKQVGLGEAIAQPWDAPVEATVASQDPQASTQVPPDQEVTLKMVAPPPPVFGDTDAREVANQVAENWVLGGGFTDARVSECHAAGVKQWACVISLTYGSAAGEATCEKRIAVTPTTDFSGLSTSSGLLGAFRETQTNCPSG